MKVLVIEDDRQTAEMVKQQLIADAHLVEVAEDGADGSFLARSYEYDAIVLDNSLPKKNGITVCREVRAAGKTTPIVFLTVDDDADTKLKAFSEGADDYMTKPFSLAELQARLRALARRSTAVNQAVICLGDLTFDTNTKTATRAGAAIHLTRKEYALFEYFMQHPGIIISRSILIEHAWTADSDPFSNTIEAHIRNLRKKLNADGRQNMIINLPGRGYVIDTPKNLSKY